MGDNEMGYEKNDRKPPIFTKMSDEEIEAIINSQIQTEQIKKAEGVRLITMETLRVYYSVSGEIDAFRVYSPYAVDYTLYPGEILEFPTMHRLDLGDYNVIIYQSNELLSGFHISEDKVFSIWMKNIKDYPITIKSGLHDLLIRGTFIEIF